MIVTFDIGDGSFDFYSEIEWESQLADWRQELADDGYQGTEFLDEDELVEMMYGEEMFFETVPNIIVTGNKISLDRIPNQTYNRYMKTKNLINQIKAFFSGDKIMTEVTRTPNYTDAMVDSMVADYQDNPTKDTVAKLASEFNKTTRSIVAKLVREGVYVAAPRVTKTGAPVVRKSEVVAQIQDQLGILLPSLEKASKQDLEVLATAITSEVERQCQYVKDMKDQHGLQLC